MIRTAEDLLQELLSLDESQRSEASPIVAEGVLAYTIPEMENHPEQRYTVPAAPIKD